MSGDEGFGLYVHWPFCLSKCPYCDFNSHVAEQVDQRAWRDALLAELEHFASRVPGRNLTSIFFGGGTPSLMDPNTTAEIISTARRLWHFAPDQEITLEANPGTADAARFQDFRDAGINRLSMGVQALNDADLKFLGRRHDVAQARNAWRAAAQTFSRVSFDLIYARPGQGLDQWRAELAMALEEVADNGITHLSLYQLTMEPGTVMFEAHARGEFALPDEELAAALFEATQEMCDTAGFGAYEISNHARGDAVCRHNLTYWRGGDYVGIGPGAHGRLTLEGATRTTRQIKAPGLWLKRVQSAGRGTQEEEILNAEIRTQELVLMGLRLHTGLDRARFARLAGHPLEKAVNAEVIPKLMAEGLLRSSAQTLAVTPRGRLTLNAITRALLV